MCDLRSSMSLSALLLCGALLACNEEAGPNPAFSCGASVDLAPLTLNAGYCVVSRLQVPNSGAFALTLDNEAPTFHSYEAAAEARTMVLRSYPLDLAQNTLGAASERFRLTVGGADDFYPGLYLARFEDAFALGYTLADYSGKVVWGLSSKPLREAVAPGNFDVAFLDRDLLLVNGLGLGTSQGQGVYALDPSGGVTKVIGEMGDGSGFIARGENILYAGYYDYASGANKLYAFTLDEVRAALVAGRALELSAGDLAYEGDLADITVSGDDLIVIDASFTEFRAVRALAATISGDAVAMQAPVALVTAEAMADAPTPTEVSADGEVIALRLGSGDEAEVALIKKH